MARIGCRRCQPVHSAEQLGRAIRTEERAQKIQVVRCQPLDDRHIRIEARSSRRLGDRVADAHTPRE
jgi:hypothetical protein